MDINLKQQDAFQFIKQRCQHVLKEKFEKDAKRGLKPRPIRAMILGIPNVGKSTLINKLAKRKATVVGDRPGVTKNQQWIRVGNDFELLDTPGILWPRFENQEIGFKLAITGAIKDTILDKDALFVYAFKYLYQYYPSNMIKRYGETIIDKDNQWIDPTLHRVGTMYGLIGAKGLVDIQRVVDFILKDIKDGRIAHVSFERCDDDETI